MKDGIESEWEEEGAELKECFESIDKDGSGSIDRTEIAALAVEMGRPMKGWELDEAMRVMDTDGSGEVTHSTTSSLNTAVTT
jgi:Ca2+-binding EF-hand superfamily protein